MYVVTLGVSVTGLISTVFGMRLYFVRTPGFMQFASGPLRTRRRLPQSDGCVCVFLSFN